MRKILLLFLFTSWAFSQSRLLENRIYDALDAFIAHPTLENLEQLDKTESTFHPKSQPEWLALVILKCNKAYYENQYGLTQKAITDYEKAWQLYQQKKLAGYDIVQSCLQPLGNLYTQIGDYEHAENTIKQYFYMANAAANTTQHYAAVLNLSNVYQNTGRVNEAVQLLETTLKSGKLTRTQTAMIWNNLGNNYLLDGKPTAKSAFEQAVKLLKADPSEAKTLSNAYRNLAKIYGNEGNFALANAYMGLAEKSFFKTQSQTPREVAALYYDQAWLQLLQKNMAAAQSGINKIFRLLVPGFEKTKGFPDKNALYAETVLLDALDLQAALFVMQNQPKKAMKSYHLAFHVEELLQAMLVYENSKIIHQLRSRNRTEKCLSIYYSLYRKERKTSYLETAFLLAENTKSAVLRQTVVASKNQSREQNLIIKQLQDWNTVIVKEQQKSVNADIAKINEAIKKQNALVLLMKSSAGKNGEASKETGQAWNIDDLYAKLNKEKALLVEYFQGNEQLFVFTLSHNTIRLDAFKNSEVGKLRSFIGFFNEANSISDNPFAFNHAANRAYNVLLLPKKDKTENLIIIPDGILNFLPFEALITKETKTTNFAEMHYLVNDFSIGYNNSAGFYLNALPFRHQKETVLGVFPVFENTALELAFSKKELENLKATFKGKYLERKAATFANFKAEARNYSVLHLSTHASAGDIYTPATIKFYEDEVLYSELYNLDLQPDLVVLSACETGVGKLYKAEGAMSIARGFQFAGAQNLLFSLWKVNDYTTSVLMEKFYHHLKNGSGYLEAGHRAKLDFLADDKVPNAKKSPYYWSAFVYYGTLETKEKPYNLTWIYLFSGLIGVVLLFRFYKKRK